MDKLYPIIRRKRRPLFLADGHQTDVPPIPTKTQPVQVLADGHQAAVPSAEPAKSAADASPKPEKSNDEDTNY